MSPQVIKHHILWVTGKWWPHPQTPSFVCFKGNSRMSCLIVTEISDCLDLRTFFSALKPKQLSWLHHWACFQKVTFLSSPGSVAAAGSGTHIQGPERQDQHGRTQLSQGNGKCESWGQQLCQPGHFGLWAETCQPDTCLEKLLKTWNSSLRAMRTNKVLWDTLTLKSCICQPLLSSLCLLLSPSPFPGFLDQVFHTQSGWSQPTEMTGRSTWLLKLLPRVRTAKLH